MDYRKFFSDDVPSFMRSPVREIFARVDLSAICSFAGGYPAASTFPTEAIKQLSARVLDKYGAKALQYGATQGVPELRAAIAERYGVPVSRVQITTSSQQGIDVCSPSSSIPATSSWPITPSTSAPCSPLPRIEPASSIWLTQSGVAEA